MPLVDNAWYVNYGNGTSTGYYAVAQWTALTAYAAGQLIRQLAAPAVGSERVFVCIVAGTTLASEPSWTLTRGAKTAEAAGPTWQECTGIAGINGDLTNTPSWTVSATPPGGVKNTAVVLGQVIKRDNAASYQICTTAGTAGNGAEPSFSDTAGTTTADNTVTWTSLGAVGNFTGWQGPHARLAAAAATTWLQIGNSIFVASNHAETQAAAISITFPGTNASPNIITCVSTAAVPPTTSATTATVTTTGNFGITYNGAFSWDGISINVGTGANSQGYQIGGSYQKFTNCALNLVNTGAAIGVVGGTVNALGGTVVFDNVTLGFTATSQTFLVRGTNFKWIGTASAITGATVPTSFFYASGGQSAALVELRGVDFSAFGSGKTLVPAACNTLDPCLFIDCKFGASVTVAATPTNTNGSYIDVVRSDSSGTNYRSERYRYTGTLTTETTIVRTGGATDGTTLISWKLVSTANSKWVQPFESYLTTIWNDSTSAITTLTIYGTTTGGGVPNNDDIWVEVEYLGSAASPLGTFITTTKASNVAASTTTNNSSDASTWGGGGAGNGFKIVVPSFTPGMKGPINITIKVAKASSTYYIDPKPEISGVTVSRSEILAPGVYMNETAAAASGGGIRLAGRGGLAMGA